MNEQKVQQSERLWKMVEPLADYLNVRVTGQNHFFCGDVDFGSLTKLLQLGVHCKSFTKLLDLGVVWGFVRIY